MQVQLPQDPLNLFDEWYRQACQSEPNDPNAICLATFDPFTQQPRARMVLLKDYNVGGFTFYTNTQSRKGEELSAHTQAAFCLYWKSLKKQIRVEGHISPVSSQEADQYFNSRPRGSQIGAWASLQSQVLDDRDTLLARVRAYEEKFAERPVPRPEHWSGFRLVATRIEFWEEKPFRLHDRFEYRRVGKNWHITRLYP